MDFAYGYKCGDLAFSHLDVPADRIYIDHDLDRARLTELIADQLRAGDVLHLIKEGHIPARSGQRRALRAAGVEIKHSPPPAKPTRPVGRPTGYVANDEHRAIWLDDSYSTTGALRLMQASRGQAYRAYGPRQKRSD